LVIARMHGAVQVVILQGNALWAASTDLRFLSPRMTGISASAPAILRYSLGGNFAIIEPSR